MPGWHERTKGAVADGRVQLVGVIQEQHADRCRLFAQWKGFEWPILQDAINALGPRVVPIVVAIDEQGIVRGVNPSQREFDDFLEQDVAGEHKPKSNVHTFSRHQLYEQTILAAKATDPASRMSATELGDGLLTWGTDADLDASIANYERAIAEKPSGPNHFRLGVALRRRYESVNRRPGDFRGAIKHWQTALDLNPNQYIWRRRIEQYGPRMMKPYAFYDWISQANEEILARGEKPIAIRGELTRAERAEPARKADFAVDSSAEPDAANRIHHDTDANVRLQSTVVPPTAAPGETVRVFLELEPNAKKQVHWTNDAGPAQLWIESSSDDAKNSARVERSLWQIPSAKVSGAVSDENRMMEFEVQVPTEPSASSVRVNGYVLYYICEGETGTCLYRRQDVAVTIPIKD